MSANDSDSEDGPNATEEPEYSDEPDQTDPKTKRDDIPDNRDEDGEDRAASDDDADEARSEVEQLSQQVQLDDETVSDSEGGTSADSEGGDSGVDPDSGDSESTSSESSGTGSAASGTGGIGGGSGGVSSTSESVDQGGSSGDSSQEFDFDPDNVEQWGLLGDYGFPPGITAANMRVAELEGYDGSSNEGLAFVTFYDNSDSVAPGFEGYITGEKTDLGNRQMVTFTFADAAGGNVPEHVGHPREDGFVAAEGVEGKNIGQAPDEWLEKVDDDEFVDEAAVQLLAGNNDCHHDNMLITPEGDVVTHDLDHSAGDMTSDFVGQKTWNDNALDRTLSEMWRSGKHTYSGSEAEFQADVTDRATELAQNLQDDPEMTAALNDAEQYDPALVDNIRTNLSEAAAGNITPEL